MTKHPLTGTTAECLAHFAAHGNRKLLRSFIPAVDIRTIERWLSGAAKPVGENLIRVRIFLDAIGYRVSELEKLDPPVLDACKIVAFDIASVDDIVGELGYPSAIGARSQTFRVLIGHARVLNNRLTRLKSFTESASDLVQEQEKSFSKRFSVPKKEPALPAQKPRAPSPMGENRNDAVIAALAAMTRAMLPLAELALSDEFSAEERQKIRDLSGGDGVFRLSNKLNRLCGERARNEL